MDFSDIEKVVRLLRESDVLTEVEVKQGNRSLRIRRPVTESFAPPPQAPRSVKSAIVSSQVGRTGKTPRPTSEGISAVVTITSPLVGIFRARKPHPIQLNDVVSASELMGQIEAMRLMNECVATTAGRIQAVLIEDGRPVEYGQPLFEIAPEAIP
jgi:biotin carboxyl carrier protein